MQDAKVVLSALDALERYARTFDEISDEQDARYSARSFVRWVRLEATAPRADNPKRDKVSEAVEAA